MDPQTDRSGGRAARRWSAVLATLAALALPLMLTLYAWRVAAEAELRGNQAQFEQLAAESEQALLARLESYQAALRAVAAFVHGSQQISREEWNRYVATLDLPRSFPGINGLGWVDAVPGSQVAAYLRARHADGAPDFAIHPAVDCDPCLVIRYLAPEVGNRAALGLDIGFEPRRRQAATASRDSGTPAITGSIRLVQDDQRTPGFLMLYPVYDGARPQGNSAERRAALRGWVLAPFIARNLLAGLTAAQDRQLTLRVHDGAPAADNLIFGMQRGSRPRAHRVSRELPVLEQRWHVEWESTLEFEDAHRSQAPLTILAGGVLLSLLSAAFVAGAMTRGRLASGSHGQDRFAVLVLPILVFLALVAGGHALREALKRGEHDHVRSQLADAVGALAAGIEAGFRDNLLAVQRIAERWEIAGGTPSAVWHADAQGAVQRMGGLDAILWFDSAHVQRWSAPGPPPQELAGRNVLEDPWLAPAARGAIDQDVARLSELRRQGGSTRFFAFVPMRTAQRNHGLLAARFDLAELVEGVLGTSGQERHAISLGYRGNTEYARQPSSPLMDETWELRHPLRLQDETWDLRVLPTEAFVAGQVTALPGIVYLASFIIAALTALSLRYALLSRAHGARLAESSQLNAAILSGSAHIVMATDKQGRIVSFNPAAEAALGYQAGELIGRQAPDFWLDPAELAARAATLSAEFSRPIAPGLPVLTAVAYRMGRETRDWTFIRRDGSRFPARLTVTPLRSADGSITGYLGIAEDISQRREVERLKEEFVTVVSHELRTPLTSIRGSLGLIVGSMAAELPARAARLITIAHNNCERLIALVNDILDSDKLASGQMRLHMQPERAADIARQALAENEGYGRRFGVSFEPGEVDESLVVHVDRGRCIQILANLLSNAAKFSPAGSSVTVHVQRHGDKARLSVCDRGAGIPPEFHDRIFGRFSQADASTRRRADGTGLGLHISRQLTEKMGGQIGFTSVPQQGTTFWVDFPLHSEHAA